MLKAVGKGMVGLSRCRVVAIIDDTRMTLTYDETRWPVVHCWFDGHVAALTPASSGRVLDLTSPVKVSYRDVPKLAEVPSAQEKYLG